MVPGPGSPGNGKVIFIKDPEVGSSNISLSYFG